MPRPPATEERRFPIMGSHGHLVVVGGPGGLAERAEARLRELEARWSRFLPSSELSRLNRAQGAPCLVSADTVVLVDAMRLAWERTGGRFDATVHDAMGAIGYGSSWPLPDAPVRLPAPPAPAPGCAGIEARPERGLVRLPRGVRLDPGGLGKGLAADLVAAELREWGADGALVNVGGDLRVTGAPPDGDAAWRVAIEHPDRPEHDVAVVDLVDGGVATSTSRRRRWTDADGADVHHLVDPSTGRSAARPWTQVSVVAGSAWWAEVLTKVVFLDGTLDDPTGAALVLHADDRTRVLGPDWFTLPEAVAS